MKYTEELKESGLTIEITKSNEDEQGYDLLLKVMKGDNYHESFYSMSNTKGYYFIKDIGTDCKNEGCEWNFDDDKIISEYLNIESLKEI
jgi:hypothetical protein